MQHKHSRRFDRNLGLAVLFGAGIMAGGPASGHHALDAMYDTATELQTMATLARVDWINPHAWMRFDIRYSNGVVERNVMIETVGIAGLRQLGIVREALKVGALYEITYHPNRDGSPGGFMTKLVTPDGKMLGEPGYDPADEEV
jgi:hypothetical protein